MILDRIIEAKKEEVAHLKQTRPLSELKAAIRNLPSPRDFRGAIKGKACAVIAEVKRRSPSKGILREDFDPVNIASIYEEYGAAAVSVLTDQKFFGGDKSYLAEIKKYMAVGKLPVEAMIQADGERSEKGDVNFIDNAVDSSTGTIRIKGTFSNRDRKLWPGQFVNVVLILTEERNVMVVPSQAVQTGQQGQYVYVVKPDLTAESRPVEAGRTINGEIVIQKGLQTGERVVTDGQLRLFPGAKVEIKNADSAETPTKKGP